MDLLDRYLATIRHNLPPARADDITDELRADLLDQVDAREAKLGRPLNDNEIAAILKEFGPPLVVAGRYRERQYLIGPDAYPYYQYSLRVVMVVVVAIFCFSTLVPVMFGHANIMRTLGHGMGNVWLALFANFAFVTIGFALLERWGVIRRHIEAWKPEQLPQYQEQKKGKWSSPIEVGLGLLMLLWWARLIPLPAVYANGGVRIEPTAIWSAWYWPIVVLLAARLIYNAICWLRPDWTLARNILGIGTWVGGIAVVARLYTSGPYVEAATRGADVARAEAMAGGINTALHIAMTVALIVWGIGLVLFVYQRFLRRFVMGR